MINANVTGVAAVHGDVEDGFGPVADVFLENFRGRQDLGAGCAAYVGGRKVVDLWAGVADRRSGKPFEHDTATVIFSCTKGIMAICAYLLVQQGRLDLDAPMARYWPEFAQGGKSAITLRQALAHRAGLSYLDRDLTTAEVIAWDPVIRAIEQQVPHSAPTDGHAYHAITIGWLVGEVIQRITGLTPGTYFRQSLGDPLELNTWIGLPDSARDQVAFMEAPLPDDDSDFAKAFASFLFDPSVERTATLGKAFAFPADSNGYVSFNAPAIQAAEIPGAGGISSAESLAKLYAASVTGLDGPPLLTAESIADGLRVQSAGTQLTGQPDDGASWGTGFQISSAPGQPLLGRGSFGHTGAGGQLAFADVDYGASFAYVTNQMGGYGDARAGLLVEALRSAIDG